MELVAAAEGQGGGGHGDAGLGCLSCEGMTTANYGQLRAARQAQLRSEVDSHGASSASDQPGRQLGDFQVALQAHTGVQGVSIDGEGLGDYSAVKARRLQEDADAILIHGHMPVDLVGQHGLISQTDPIHASLAGSIDNHTTRAASHAATPAEDARGRRL